jgi:hypothetical protein
MSTFCQETFLYERDSNDDDSFPSPELKFNAAELTFIIEGKKRNEIDWAECIRRNPN